MNSRAHFHAVVRRLGFAAGALERAPARRVDEQERPGSNAWITAATAVRERNEFRHPQTPSLRRLVANATRASFTWGGVASGPPGRAEPGRCSLGVLTVRIATRVGFSVFMALAFPMTFAKAAEGDLESPPPAVAEHTPAYSFANLSDDQALAELVRRKLPFDRVEGEVPGVRTP